MRGADVGRQGAPGNDGPRASANRVPGHPKSKTTTELDAPLRAPFSHVK